MAALSAAGITMHNAAYIAERRHATASSCRMGADILTIGPMIARQRTLASCRVSPADQAVPARMIPLMEQKTAILLAAPLGAGSVAFSPDGKLLASAYSDGTVWLWNPATGHGMPATTPSAASAVSVAFSPDGKLLASAYSDGTIRLWNPATGHGVVLPASSAASAVSVAFSPDGKLLAGAYSDGIIRLWNPVTGQAAGSLPRTGTGEQTGAGGQSGAVSVAFSPDGKLLASAYSNGTIRLWNPATGQPAGTASGGWLVTAAAVIAIAVSVLAAAITTREIHFSSRRILRPGSKLWKYC
jgi:WD40 repeat protein